VLLNGRILPTADVQRGAAASATSRKNPRFSGNLPAKKTFGGAGDAAVDAGAAARPPEELLAQMGLETVRQSKAYMLSGGERRRLEIARS